MCSTTGVLTVPIARGYLKFKIFEANPPKTENK